MEMVNGFPRRNRVDLHTPAEAAIHEAMLAVEAAGAHPLLTDAVELLGQAKNKVADFVELKPATKEAPKSETPGDSQDRPDEFQHFLKTQREVDEHAQRQLRECMLVEFVNHLREQNRFLVQQLAKIIDEMQAQNVPRC